MEATIDSSRAVNTDSLPAFQSADPLLVHDVRFHRSLSWGAIIAGVVMTVGIHLLLLALGAAIGLASFTPLTDQNPAEDFAIGSVIAWGLCALAALFAGGWIAGSFSAGPKSGCLHGMIVWGVSMIVSFLFVSTGGGAALGGALKALGTGLGMTGQAAVASATGAAAGGVATAGAQQGKDHVSSFIDEALKSSPTNATAASAIRAKREVSFAVMRLFNPGNDINSADNRMGVEKALTQYAGISDADAKKMVDEWTASYQSLKTELAQEKAAAEQKAREVAEKDAKHLAGAATMVFFAFVIGLVVTMLGGIHGAKITYRHTAMNYVPQN